MTDQPDSSSGRLRTRVTLLFFVAAAPAAIVSALAMMLADRELEELIAAHAAQTSEAAKWVLTTQERRVKKQVSGLLSNESLGALAGSGLELTAEHEELASRLASPAGLEILAIVALEGPQKGRILSSAHLPTAAGDPAPSFVLTSSDAAAGYVQELVRGNPPKRVSALVAVRRLRDDEGRATIALYGGLRLDRKLLAPIAQMGRVTLILDDHVDPPITFAPDGLKPDPNTRPDRRIAMASLDPEVEAPEIGVIIHNERLTRLRRSFLFLAGALVLVAFGAALFLGPWFSAKVTERILELSNAASRVGSGDLSVRVTPSGNDEVTALMRIFNTTVVDLSESQAKLRRAERVAAWREAARRIAHEIKNPLFPMQMAMETLRKAYNTKHEDLDAIVEESTTAVLEEVRSLSRLVSEFSEFARLPKPKLEPVPASALLDQARRLYEENDPRAEIVIDDAAIESKKLANVLADQEQMGRVLINLVKNALEAMPEGRRGRIELDANATVKHGADGITITVSDNGPGMDGEIRAQIFSPYFTTKTEGTGLGLTIVERIVSEHEGTIEVDSAPGRGTTFRIFLRSA